MWENVNDPAGGDFRDGKVLATHRTAYCIRTVTCHLSPVALEQSLDFEEEDHQSKSKSSLGLVLLSSRWLLGFQDDCCYAYSAEQRKLWWNESGWSGETPV